MAATALSRLAIARRFGIELGVACIALALLLLWRRALPDLRTALLIAGIMLTALGVLRPALLAPVATRWMWLGERIASVTTPLVLTLIYFILVTPLGIARRTFGRSPIRRDHTARGWWVARTPSTPDERRAAMEHQF